MVLHADAITEDRATTERAGRIDREHTDFVTRGVRCVVQSLEKKLAT